MSDTHCWAVVCQMLMGCVLINVSGFPRRDVQLSLLFYIMKFHFELLFLKLKAAQFPICYATQNVDKAYFL